MEANTGGRPPRLLEFGGEGKTVAELAALAGCSAQAMRKRLKRRDAKQAVDVGPSKTGRGQGWKKRFFEVNGETLDARQLAERAGCNLNAMLYRLRGMSPEKALAMGPASRANNAASRRSEVKAKRAEQPKKAAAKRVDDFQRRIKPGSKLDALTQPKQAGPVGEIIVPKGVKRTVAPPIPERFAVDPKRMMFSFGRIGEYGVCSGWAEAVAGSSA